MVTFKAMMLLFLLKAWPNPQTGAEDSGWTPPAGGFPDNDTGASEYQLLFAA